MRILSALVAIVCFGSNSDMQLSAAEPTAADLEFFEQKVRPLFAAHCYTCHADAKQMKRKSPAGGLRLDAEKFFLEGGDSGPAMVPGKPDESLLIEAVRYTNVDLQMPPKGKLPTEAIAILEDWVKRGAPWPKDTEVNSTVAVAEFDLQARKKSHWAWQPLQKLKLADPANDIIVALWQKKLIEQKLIAAKPAEPLTLFRRIHFTLTGLPPTADAIQQFLEKPDATKAIDETIDRLLDSPQFGERWARHWLDLVRYAESRGHEFEPDIPNAHEYRDYVVRALNADVPYNQLALEHLAGDVLREPRINAEGTNESVIGAGFFHLGEEVHSPVDIRQDQADRFDNRIDVMTKTFLGLTVACARCHDHKFDAISQKDYYALFGLLEGSSFRQVRIDGWQQNRAVADKLAKLRQQMRQVVEVPPPKSDRLAKWLGQADVIVDYANIQPGQWLPDDVTFGTEPTPAGGAYLVNSEVRIEPRTAAVFDPFWKNLTLSPGTAKDFGPLGKKLRSGFSIRTPTFELQKKQLYYLVRGAGLAYAAVNQHTVLAGPLHQRIHQQFPDSQKYRWIRHDLSNYVGHKLHVELTADPNTPFAVAMIVQADSPPPPPEEAEPLLVSSLTVQLIKQWQDTEAELSKEVVWQSRLALSMWDGNAVNENLFIRGNPKATGEIVPHRYLEALAGTEAVRHTTGSGRLEVAQQIVDPQQSPLFARVAVNRIWHHLFGRGIVASTDNFGLLGEAPTDPELLDALAQEYQRSGWSTKAMIRRLMKSPIYQMSSDAHPTSANNDPTNKYLHSFRIKRLEGEAIRDSLLSVSGRLDSTIGGPSVLIHLTPFLDGRGRPASGPVDGNGRRSLYLAVRRNFLSPFLQAFDTPMPFSTVGKRQVSNVPAQALILLNDPFVHQQAELWAKAILAKPLKPEERIERMYWQAFGRKVTEKERQQCLEFVGESETLETWKDFAHTLFNVKEFIYIR